MNLYTLKYQHLQYRSYQDILHDQPSNPDTHLPDQQVHLILCYLFLQLLQFHIRLYQGSGVIEQFTTQMVIAFLGGLDKKVPFIVFHASAPRMPVMTRSVSWALCSMLRCAYLLVVSMDLCPKTSPVS